MLSKVCVCICTLYSC